MELPKKLAVLAVLGGLILAAGVAAEAGLDEAARARFSGPEATALPVGDGIRLRIRGSSKTTAAPLVVFEAGLGGSSLDWQWVQSALEPDARTLSYDRAGIGWSDPTSGPVDASAAAVRLHHLINQAGAPDGVILVAHSLGGAHALVYHQLYPSDVRGIVLIDPVHPDQMVRLPRTDVDGDRHFFTRIRIASQLARFGVMRLFQLWDGGGAALGASSQREAQAIQASHRHLTAMAHEVDAWDTMLAQMNQALPARRVPAMILSASLPATEGTRVFQALHDDIAARLPGARHVIVPGADHQGLLHQRDKAAATVDAVRDVLRQIKS